MVSSWLKTLIAIVGMTASFYSAATIPDYDGTYNNDGCFENSEQYKVVREKVSQLGEITHAKSKQLADKPTLREPFNSIPNLLMIPFPQEISDRVSQDRMYTSSEFADKTACVYMFEIDYHKIAYHLVYRLKDEQVRYRDIGTVIVADNKKKDEFTLCKSTAKGLIENGEKKGIYRKSYQFGIGIPFGFNSITKSNRNRLNGIPSDAVQCQIKALPRENSDYEYILYYAWRTIKKGGLFSDDESYINWRVVSER